MRRRVLLVAGAGLLGGCLGDGTAAGTTATTSTDPTATTTAGDEADAPDGVPVPDGECTVADLPDGDYPSLPGTLDDDAATEFAIAFEKAYATAELETDEDVRVSGFDGWDARVMERFESGVLVAASVSVDFSEEGYGTGTMLGSTPSHGWYFVTEGYAARAPGEENPGDPPTYTWELVACG
ncbi:hypothetical protein [Haloarchaeobius amylolyticus]|uniref:hypothetical protein n=1 Tax=Haloarchaeobius amylolyticus TaxID=1198296 RepID=UPI00226F27D5|nr:hypothetical protein [Haloarchaeobius amylolyticus]